MRQPNPILEAGFRPFFLLAGLAAVVVMARTLVVFAGLVDSPPAGIVRWHGHEMLFGYLAAAMTGFLLTAVPNWTATVPLRGLPLFWLALLWLAGRAALWQGSPGWWGAAADVAFVPVAALVAGHPLWQRRQLRAVLPLAVFLLIGGANLAWHLGFALALPAFTERVTAGTTMLVALLIAVIGGRITPAFTRNALHARGGSPLPRAPGWIDAAALAASGLLVPAALLLPAVVAPLAAVTAVLHGLRLVGWRGWRTTDDPLLLVLHLGMAWLAIGYGVQAAAPLVDAAGPGWALHGLLAGAAGTMSLAVMARATLGHTGRPLRAGGILTAAVLLVQAAALSRLVAPWTGTTAWLAAAAFWCLAFLLFLGRCAPMLMTARLAPGPASTT